MSSIVKFTCLSGGQDCSPPCYLLQIDQFKCLLDCGWDEKFSMSIVEEIGKHFRYLDAIFISFPDPAHLGALPYLIKKYGLPCPIYATRPVTLLGQMFMTDLLLSQRSGTEFDLFSLDDIKALFDNDKIVHLSFKQTFHLEGKGDGLSVIPLPAGHMVGGTIWKIVTNNDENIVYAIDYNHKKERHLNGCALRSEDVKRPSLLITDAYNATSSQTGRNERDEKFLEVIHTTLERGGNVLIACDTAGRVLEIAYMLEHIWRRNEKGLAAYRLAMVSNVATRTMEITKSTMEWMSDSVQREFNSSRDNPFEFRHLKLREKLLDLGPVNVKPPIVVIATPSDLELGFSRDIFAIWSSEEHTIILTQRPTPGTLAYDVLNLGVSSGQRRLKFEIRARMELKDDELEAYRREEEEKRKQQALIDSQRSLAIDDNDVDDDEDEDDEADDLTVSESFNHNQHRPTKHDLMLVDNRRKSTVFFKQIRKAYPMFPGPVERKVKVDDYGEEINPEDYMLSHKMQGSKIYEVEANKENQLQKQPELMEQPEPKIEETKPTKCVAIMLEQEIRSNIFYFDFEGRSDGESIKNLVSVVNPRRLILVRGSPESIAHMTNYCRRYVHEGKIHTPSTGEQVFATTENHIYQVKLKDSLISSLEFAQANEGVELAWIDVLAHMPEQEEGDDENIENDKLPSLDIIEPDKVPSHKSIFVNEFKLSNFKQVLLSHGIQAEFSEGGVLFCNDKVTVRRKNADEFHLEGVFCDDYYKVRDLLYDQYVLI